MNKKFTIAIVMVVIGASTVIGSGAYSAAQMERGANIDVVNDANGLLALDTDVDSDVVREENGELSIDLSADQEGVGVNVDSRYQLGAFQSGTPGTLSSDGYPAESAIVITNHDTEPHRVTFTYEDDDGDMGGSEIRFQAVGDVSNGYRGPNGATADDSSPSVTMVSSSSLTDSDGPGAADELDPGESMRISILIDTRGGEVGDDLSGTITISSD